jgi:hypothetical protein
MSGHGRFTQPDAPSSGRSTSGGRRHAVGVMPAERLRASAARMFKGMPEAATGRHDIAVLGDRRRAREDVQRVCRPHAARFCREAPARRGLRDRVPATSGNPCWTPLLFAEDVARVHLKGVERGMRTRVGSVMVAMTRSCSPSGWLAIRVRLSGQINEQKGTRWLCISRNKVRVSLRSWPGETIS